MGKHRQEEAQTRRKSQERSCRCVKRQESRETPCFFQWFVALVGRKVGSLKRRVPAGRRCGAKHISKSTWANTQKTHHSRTTLEVEMPNQCSKFGSKKWQNLTAPENFQKLRCRKSARRCGAKHMSKSKWQRPDVEKVHAVVGAKLIWQSILSKTEGLSLFWGVKCRLAEIVTKPV